MSTQSLADSTPVYFRTADGDPRPEMVIYALEGVALAIDDAGPTEDMDAPARKRVAGLTVAASVLANWLTERLTIAPPTAGAA